MSEYVWVSCILDTSCRVIVFFHWGMSFSSEEIVYEIHLAVVGALVELGLDAFACRRRGTIRENIIIRVELEYGKVEVWTAFVDGTTLALGKSDLYMHATFDLNDPGCFERVVAFLRGNREEWVRFGFRDERFGLGDIIEGWVKVTPGFHLNPRGDGDGKWNLGWV